MGERGSQAISLDHPPPGHMQKVSQDFQFSPGIWSFRSSFAFCLLLLFFLILQPGAAVTSDDIAR